MLRILLIDDSQADRLLAIRELRRTISNVQIQEVSQASDFTPALEAGKFDLVILDYQLRWNNGLTLLQSIKSRYPNCPVIMFTNSGSEEIAVEGMKQGLSDYVPALSRCFFIFFRFRLTQQSSGRDVRFIFLPFGFGDFLLLCSGVGAKFG
jgi:DNA-binding NarL/FixJ family response regulator